MSILYHAGKSCTCPKNWSAWHADKNRVSTVGGHVHRLTYSMGQSPSGETNRFSSSKKIPGIQWNPKVHYCLYWARHLSPSWDSSIQSIPPHSTSWRSILILSSHLRLGLPSGHFPSGFPTKTLYAPLLSHTCSIHLILLYWSPE